MADTNPPLDTSPPLDTDPPITTMVNVLTIVTFVFSGFSLAGAVLSYLIAPFSLWQAKQIEGQIGDHIDQLPDFFRYFFGNGLKAARLAAENRTPILLFSLLATGFYVFGALQMRKMKKLGFYLYVFGSLIPLVNYLFFIGFSPLSLIGIVFGYTLLLAFIVLYATQLKNMK